MFAHPVIARLADRAGSRVATIRRAVARHRWYRVLAIASACSIVAWSHLAITQRARDAADEWGARSEVWVAIADHRPGDPMRAERRSVPVVVVPREAASSVDPEVVAHRHVGEGEIVVAADLAPRPGRFALAPPGSIVVPVADPLAPDASVGDRVVVATEGIVLAADAVVVHAAGGVTHVAVPAAEAPQVAAAAASSLASLLFLPSVTG